ncbi:DUF3107 domain-containing protein [Trueperella pecoris]|uniref:DUF3107 domain-containing protein n=1 Tax=Trueperella pecoris TaxID=2733571 RepID=A0A7M1QYS9_9ACTO|nr:DUF3107 domain-containing protein [Trueperella pecoris]QOR47043.1 DUF3107 domain-containing protein [Trueperella pecoris]
MEISIGIRNVARELTLDADLTAEQVTAKVNDAIASNSVLSLTDKDGQVVVVPVQALGYVQCKEAEVRRVGFGF